MGPDALKEYLKYMEAMMQDPIMEMVMDGIKTEQEKAVKKLKAKLDRINREL